MEYPACGGQVLMSLNHLELHYILTPLRGKPYGNAWTDDDDSMCPDQTGHTWKYWNVNEENVMDAGEGLEVKCAGQCFRSVKRKVLRNGICTNIFCCYTPVKINFIACAAASRRPTIHFSPSPSPVKLKNSKN